MKNIISSIHQVANVYLRLHVKVQTADYSMFWDTILYCLSTLHFKVYEFDSNHRPAGLVLKCSSAPEKVLGSVSGQGIGY